MLPGLDTKPLLAASVGSRDPDSKVHGANMGPIWGRQDPGGPHVGPMNLAIWGNSPKFSWNLSGHIGWYCIIKKPYLRLLIAKDDLLRKNIPGPLVITVSAESLEPLCGRTSVDTMMTKFASVVCTGLAYKDNCKISNTSTPNPKT